MYKKELCAMKLVRRKSKQAIVPSSLTGSTQARTGLDIARSRENESRRQP